MRRMNQEYAQNGRFYPDSAGIRAAAEEVVRDAAPGAKIDLGDFFARYVAGTDELPLADWLSRAGLTLRVTGERRGAAGEDPSQIYAIEEAAHPTEKQLRIRDGLLQGHRGPDSAGSRSGQWALAYLPGTRPTA